MSAWLDDPAITDWDDAYSNVDHIEGAQEYIDTWPVIAGEYRSSANARLNIAYGPGERQVMDLFMPTGTARGLFMFVHGGYWVRFDKSMWSQLAAGAVAAGWVVAIPSYTLCPDVRISAITREITLAVETAAGEVDGPLVLCGHSAGGHLVTRQICTDTGLSPQTLARVRRVISISGVHDLRPLMRLTLNQTLQLDEEEALLESPALLQPVEGMVVDCIVGADERPEFIRQNDLLANIWRGLGAHTSLHRIDGRHHFDVIDDLTRRDGLIIGLAEAAVL